MAKKYYFIIITLFAITTGLIFGVIWGFSTSKGKVTSAEADNNKEIFVPGPHTNAKIEELNDELDKVTQYEMAYGCLERNRFGDPVLCGKSKERVDALHDQLVEEVRKHEMRGPEAVAAVTANVRTLVGDTTLLLKFEGTSANPYTNNGKRIEFYRDQKGMSYWIDPTTNKVVQFGPGPNSTLTFSESPKLSFQELKLKAESFLARNIMDFKIVKKTFVYSTSAKDETSVAFRWDAQAKPQGEDMFAFVQVVISSGGDIASFNDTRSLYSTDK